jgi:hypothetical protein
MKEIDLAAAVRTAVNDWMIAATTTQQQVQMANPATLSAVLGLAVQHSLAIGGCAPADVRARVLSASYLHLKAVFDSTALVDTPTAFYPVPDTVGSVAGRAAALAVHGVMHLETVSYGTENEGNLFVNLVTMPGSGALAEKSKKSMRGHTDGVSFPFNGDDDSQDARIAPSPDLVTLVGLRNPEDVPTKLMPLPDVLARMTQDDVNELKKPQYSIRSQKTFIQGMKRILGKEHVIVDQPILKATPGGAHIRYSHSNVVPSTSGGSAEHASNRLEEACNQAAVLVVVQPGDVLIVNNRLSLHGRGEVGDEIGGRSRWLLRTYGLDTSNLPTHKRHLGGAPTYVLFP